MKFTNPSPKTLFFCWLALMALTIGTMLSGHATSDIALSDLLILALGLITWVKAMVILRYYLNLRAASRGWNRAFSSYLFVVLGIIMAIFIVGKL
ncbi:MAG: cytochrome C oxidase subunit IV family protein [Emcibacter sp.]|nr:cytochrome C oxidase subunit IV family protein [Emcibacter sp.]